MTPERTDVFIEPERAFLGVGLAFPVAAATDGGAVAMAAAEEDIRQSIRIILSTSGERAMRPDFGAGLRDLVFEPINRTTMELVRFRVEQALTRWEPRIDTVEVRVSASDAARGRLDVDINYRVRATNTFYNLVFPFYLEEAP
jgi:phage baseplate assembly protein W